MRRAVFNRERLLSSWVGSVAVGALLASLLVAPATAQPGEPDRPPGTVVLPRVPPVDDLPKDRPLRAGFLVIDGVDHTELAVPVGVLHRTVFHTKPGIEVILISPDGEPVRSSEGLLITPDHGFSDAPALDILVVPGSEHSLDSDLGDEALIQWVRTTGEKAHYVASLSDGAFVVAKAGLVKRKRVTTFPGHQDAFASMFPKVDLERDVSFVHDGPVLASQGGARSFDVALYFVDHLYGEEVAHGVAEDLVLPWPPVSEPFRALIVERKWTW